MHWNIEQRIFRVLNDVLEHAHRERERERGREREREREREIV